MKTRNLAWFAPPVIALALVGIWIRTHPVGPELNQEDVQAAESRSTQARERTVAAAPDKVLDPEKVGWKAFGEMLANLQKSGDPVIRKPLLANLDQIKRMSAEDLATAIESVDAESFADPEAKAGLLSILCRELSVKNPMKLLDLARSTITDGHFRWAFSLRDALGKAASTSPREAIAWMDEVISKGAFDHRGTEALSPIWLTYETALVFGLLLADPSLAAQRVDGLPAEARRSVLNYGFMGFTLIPELYPAYIRLCRTFLDSDEMAGKVSSLASHVGVSGGITAVSHLFGQIETTPGERAEVVAHVVSDHLRYVQQSGQPGLKDVEEIRAWVTALGSGDLGRATGDALGFLAGTPALSVDQAFAEVRRYHAESGSDGLLSEFLGWPVAWRNRDQCLELAGLIRNERLRKESMTPPQ